MNTRYLDIPDENPSADTGAASQDTERDTLRALFGRPAPTEPATDTSVANDPVPSAGRTPTNAPYPGKNLNDWLRGW